MVKKMQKYKYIVLTVDTSLNQEIKCFLDVCVGENNVTTILSDAR